jgi:2,3,4,5-tetrahydropyridine-2-carboxylate N-succinyltransferase
MTELREIIENAWDNRELLKEEATTNAIRKGVD